MKTSDTVRSAVDLLKNEKERLQAELKRVERSIDILDPPRAVKRPALPAPRSTKKASAKAKAPRKIAKRKRKGGTRAEQAVALINKAGEKGIDATKIAKVMKIKPNYLYRVMGNLEGEGLVRKEGRIYFPVA